MLSFFTESRESLMTTYTCVYRPYPGGVASILNIGKHFSLSFFFNPASLLMGSLPLQTIVNMWQHFHLFFKACTSVRAKINLQH